MRAQAVSLLLQSKKKPLAAEWGWKDPTTFKTPMTWSDEDPLVSASAGGHVGVVRLLLSRLEEEAASRRLPQERVDR